MLRNYQQIDYCLILLEPGRRKLFVVKFGSKLKIWNVVLNFEVKMIEDWPNMLSKHMAPADGLIRAVDYDDLTAPPTGYMCTM